MPAFVWDLEISKGGYFRANVVLANQVIEMWLLKGLFAGIGRSPVLDIKSPGYQEAVTVAAEGTTVV